MANFEDELDDELKATPPAAKTPAKPAIKPDTPISMTAKDLQDLVAAIKAPNVLEQQKINKEMQEQLEKNNDRKETAAGVIALQKQKRDIQRICSHKHKNGQSHGVFITERRGPGYIICQKNQCIIRPGIAPEDYTGGDIYSTDLFNEMLQELPTAEIFG